MWDGDNMSGDGPYVSLRYWDFASIVPVDLGAGPFGEGHPYSDRGQCGSILLHYRYKLPFS